MRIGIPGEITPGERRVAVPPSSVPALIGLGYQVEVEAGAGARASFPDTAYAEAGARVLDPQESVWGADLILAINPPSAAQVAGMRPGSAVAALLAPAVSPELVESLCAQGVTALSMDAVPRISRAQSMDVLSSMAGLGGYRAVIEAANLFGGVFTGQITAAGSVPPANVLVVGAGVAGLAAIGTARSLGAIVRAFDARAEAGEQVESMGAQFLRIERTAAESGPSATGYAREMGEDFERRAAELYATQLPVTDIVVTTALIPGRPAPRLITESMLASMRPGSVIVDMAAGSGGNVAGSRPGEVVTTDAGVVVIGYTDLPGRLPTQASKLYGTNMVNLLTLMTPGRDGVLTLDLTDPIVRGICVTRGGEILPPAPPVQVTATSVDGGAGGTGDDGDGNKGDGSNGDGSNRRTVAAPGGAVREAAPTSPRGPSRLVLAGALVAVLVLAASPFVPVAFLGHLMVFALAVVVGFYVISNVTHALHTPLMAETNAISGIILVGGVLQLGSPSTPIRIVAFAATLIASINIVGGFAVTSRMLQMFRKDPS